MFQIKSAIEWNGMEQNGIILNIGRNECNDEDEITIKTDDCKIIKVNQYRVKAHRICFKEVEKAHYSIINDYIPLQQRNSIIIHKCQGMTLHKAILNCDGIFENSMFYT